MNLFIFKGRGKSSVGLVQKKGEKRKWQLIAEAFFCSSYPSKKVVVVQIVAKNPRRATMIVVAPGTT